MSARRRRLAGGIDLVTSIGHAVGAWRDGFLNLGMKPVVRLSYQSSRSEDVMELERYVLTDRPHFLLQGEIGSVDAVPSFMSAGSRFSATVPQDWGSILLTMARGRDGMRTLSLTSVGSPPSLGSGLLGARVFPLLLSSGAVESRQGVLEMGGEVELEAWYGVRERLFLRENRPSRIPEAIASAVFGAIARGAPVLVGPKSWVGEVRSRLEDGAVTPTRELEPLVAYEAEAGDWRSNVDEDRLPELGVKIRHDLPSSGGVVELIALRETIEGVAPVVSVQVGWFQGKTEVSWVPVSRNGAELGMAWKAFRGFAQL